MLLDSEWLVGVKYEHLTPTLVFQPTVMLVRSRDQRVKATVAIRVHISREAALLQDEWSSRQGLTTEWTGVLFEAGKRMTWPSERKRLCSSLVGTSLALEIEVRMFDVAIPCPVTGHEAALQQQASSTQVPWQESISSLFPDVPGADVTLVAEGQEMRAHSLVLICRSQYFRGHLTHDRREKIVLNASPAAAVEMLRFMYRNEVSRMEEVALELLQVADYYGVVDLLTAASEHLMSHLSPHNVVKVIDYASLAGLQELREMAVRTFVEKIGDETWKAQFASLAPSAQLIIRSLATLCRAILPSMRTPTPPASDPRRPPRGLRRLSAIRPAPDSL